MYTHVTQSQIVTNSSSEGLLFENYSEKPNMEVSLHGTIEVLHEINAFNKLSIILLST